MANIKKQDLDKIIYYQVPKWLFDLLLDNKVSLGACKTYILMYDRLKISARNNWHDNDGNVYIKYSYTEMQKDLKCSRQTVSNNIKDLVNLGLIDKKRQFNSSSIFYLNIVTSDDLQDVQHSSLENLTSKENLTNSSLENLTNSSLEVLDSNKNNRVRIKNNNNNVIDNFSAVGKKEAIPSAVRQEIEMAIRSNNWNITIQKLLMLAEGDYMLVLQQIKHFGEKGLRYTIAAIKGKYEINEEPTKSVEDEKKERFKEWEHSIQLIEHQYKNCKEKIKPEIYQWMGEFLKERGII